jgi:hypothetical protein
MLEALKSPQIKGFFSPWRDANAFAVASAILSLVDHGIME